jgi:hypothetical protein
MSKSKTTHMTGQIGGTDLIVCSKCGWTHMRLMDCSDYEHRAPVDWRLGWMERERMIREATYAAIAEG